MPRVFSLFSNWGKYLFGLFLLLVSVLKSSKQVSRPGIMLIKFLEKGLTAILIAHVFIVSIIIGYILNLYHIG